MDFHLLNDAGGLLSELLLHIEVASVPLVKFTVDDLLKLVSDLLSNKVSIEVSMVQLVPLKTLQDDMRVKVLMIRR